MEVSAKMLHKRNREKAYRDAHIETSRARSRASYKRNSEKRKAYQRRYREDYPDKIRSRAKRYYESNSDKILERSRQYYRDNPERVAANNARWQRENPEKVRAAKRRYEQSHKSEIIAYRRIRTKTDPDYRLRAILRRRISVGIRRAGGKTFHSAQALTGCGYSFLRGYIEARWKMGMTWENYGRDWHIDHRIPLSRFNLLDVDEQKKCFHYSNLQPLWAGDNLRKGDTLPEIHQAELI